MNIPGTVHDILQCKQNGVWTTTPDATVFDALKIMGEKNIGALVVLDDTSVAGIITERDYSRKIVLQGRTSRDTRVSEILSRPAALVPPSKSIESCMQIMLENRVRHLPVIDDGKLCGLVSMGDLMNWVIRAQKQTIEQLHGYISGSYPG